MTDSPHAGGSDAGVDRSDLFPSRPSRKTRREALGALKRHLARVVFNLLRGQQPIGPAERVVKVRSGKVRVPALA